MKRLVNRHLLLKRLVIQGDKLQYSFSKNLHAATLFFYYICKMKKGCFLAFLLPVFFIPAWVYAGNSACEKQPGADFNYAHSNAYANIEKDQLPGLSKTRLFCVSAASTAITCIKILSLHIIHSCGLNCSHLASSPGNRNEFFLQKNYLFYIYPSHYFW